MTRIIGILAAALLAAAPVALAQEAPPPQIANTYDGTHHQPTAGSVGQAEEAAGLDNPTTQQQQTNEVESLDQQVLRNAQQSTGNLAGCTTDRSQCSP